MKRPGNEADDGRGAGDRDPACTRDLTLLVITPDYPDKDDRYIGSIFVKDQIGVLKSFFRRIIVISPVLFSFGILPNDKYCADYQYDNVSVYYPRCFFLPRILPVPFLSGSMKKSFDRRFAAVRRTIKKHNLSFDLIHAHFTWPSAHIALRLKQEFPVPVVATIHEDSSWFAEEIAENDSRIEAAWRGADMLIRVNASDVPTLQVYNPCVISIPNGFTPRFRPIDKAACRKKLGLPPDPVILFTFGMLLERKGFQYLIDAMKILSASGEPPGDIRCYISGKGQYRRSLEEQVKQLGLVGRVTVFPYIPTDELPFWINSADLFIFPSLEESFGIVQIEALACGKPVIATRNAGSMDVIRSEDVGILCRTADAAALADAIRCGLSRSWDPRKIAGYAQRYAWETVAREILDAYADVLRGGTVS